MLNRKTHKGKNQFQIPHEYPYPAFVFSIFGLFHLYLLQADGSNSALGFKDLCSKNRGSLFFDGIRVKSCL